jgi:Raf kinase inhibitor-like YbhB/YbcL family protein
MKLSSSAYSHGSPIPKQFTCEGQNISPDFSWSASPKETKSFLLVLHDPDAPRKNGFTHWMVYNIPPGVNRLKEDLPTAPAIPGVGSQARNDAGKIGYVGPCPPIGMHRYFARLYALRAELNVPPGADHVEVTRAMQDKIIDMAELLGTYAMSEERSAA